MEYLGRSILIIKAWSIFSLRRSPIWDKGID